MKTLVEKAAEFGIVLKHNNISLPTLPDWTLVGQIPEFQRLATRCTTTRWHQESNMLTHTKMVCSQMQQILDKDYYTDRFALVMMLAALMHDIGKCDAENTPDGKLLSDGHPLLSERICRRLLWDLDIEDRELICELVRLHDLHCTPDISDRKLLHKINAFSPTLFKYPALLGNLFKADDLGGIKDVGLYGSGERMYSRILNLMSQYRFHVPAVKPEKMGRFTVYMMCGLPGTGKSTWCKEHHPDLPVVSRDLIREEMGMCEPGKKCCGTSDEEAEVTRRIDEQVTKLCEKHQSFVYDNMNTREKYRRSFLNLIKRYHPRIVIVYLEVTDMNVLYERRPEIRRDIYEHMFDQMEFPRPDEYDRLMILTNHSVGCSEIDIIDGYLKTCCNQSR